MEVRRNKTNLINLLNGVEIWMNVTKCSIWDLYFSNGQTGCYAWSVIHHAKHDKLMSNDLAQPCLTLRWRLLVQRKVIVYRIHVTNMTQGQGLNFGHNFGLTTCSRPQLKLYYFYCYYDLGLMPVCGARCRKLQPNLAPMPKQFPIDITYKMAAY